jgi:hypothetical protein
LLIHTNFFICFCIFIKNAICNCCHVLDWILTLNNQNSDTHLENTHFKWGGGGGYKIF